MSTIEFKSAYKLTYEVSCPWTTCTWTKYFETEEAIDTYIAEELPKVTNISCGRKVIPNTQRKSKVLLLEHEDTYYTLGEQITVTN